MSALGSLYFIREGKTGPIKIGWTSKGVTWRRNSLQGGNPTTLYILGAIEGVSRSVEAEWHVRFRDLHFRAEWFLPARRLLSAIEIEATPVEHKENRPYTPRALGGGGYYRGSAGIAVVSEWMRRHEISVEKLAELTGYKPGYLGELLEGRAPFGRETAKRFYSLGGSELHPAKLLADRLDRSGIKQYLARVGEAA